MKKIITIILFFVTLNLSSQSDLCLVKTEKIFENIINNIANNLPAPPDFEIVSSTKRAAYISGGVIYIEKRLIKLFCGENRLCSPTSFELTPPALYLGALGIIQKSSSK